MNLASPVADRAARHPDRLALRLDDVELTYSELDTRSAAAGAFLRDRGLQPGDRVGLMLPNVPAFTVLYYGILRAGGVVVPMNPLLNEREVRYYLADSGAREIFVGRAIAGEAPAAAVTVDDAGSIFTGGDTMEIHAAQAADTAVILYTSGTTGLPKGAELTHDNLSRNRDISIEICEIEGDHACALGAVPLFHSFGQTSCMNALLAAGGWVTLLERFDAEAALRAIERDAVTHFLGVPTMYSALLRHPGRERFDTSSLQVCVSGGSALPVALLHDFEAAFGCTILEGYGLSETSPVATCNRLDRQRKPGSIGTPIPGVEMKVVGADGRKVPVGEVGELLIRGHNVMKGYWDRPDASREAITADGWFHTGDLGKADDDGYFYIVDRKTDVIIRDGYNVYPREIEEVLHEHPAVLEAAVVGVAHPKLGEEIAAAVVLRPGVNATPAELRQFVRRQVAPYKYPRHVWISQSLPKGPSGKIRRGAIEPPADLLSSS